MDPWLGLCWSGRVHGFLVQLPIPSGTPHHFLTGCKSNVESSGCLKSITASSFNMLLLDGVKSTAASVKLYTVAPSHETVCVRFHQHIQRKLLRLVATVCGDACSVLIHLLPGLALFAQRHFPPPEAASRIRWLSLPQYTGEHDGSATFWWFLVAPFIFYATWQTVYWFIVQVAMLWHLKPLANTALQ